MVKKTRSGRRPGMSEAREQILAAARQSFTEMGFERTTLRGVAAQAGVDPALILHYFGSKRGLFVEAADVPFPADAAFNAIFGEGLDEAGERILRLFLSIWDVEVARSAFIALIRAAMTDEQAAAMFRERIGAAVLERVTGRLAVDHPAARASLVATQLVGIAVGRYIVQLPALVAMDREELVGAVAPTLQRYLTAPLALEET